MLWLRRRNKLINSVNYILFNMTRNKILKNMKILTRPSLTLILKNKIKIYALLFTINTLVRK